MGAWLGWNKNMSADFFSEQLLKKLEAKAEFHRTNKHDPHGIGTAVYVALLEVSKAIKEIQAENEA